MIGQTISHYKILEKLGEGGMGVVYKAQDLKLDRLVALKFLSIQFTANESERKRFVHEAKAASALDHPNICTFYELGETDRGQMFIAMAYYEGQTAKDKIKDRPLPVDEAIDIAIAIAQGLAKAHEKGITHRDIKSENIMVTGDSGVKIMDFGLASITGVSALTKTGASVGTVPYMSPEQARGEKADHRSDIWSFGAVLYEMVTGQMPFKSQYNDATVYSILNENPRPVTALRTGIPMELERIIVKCLEKNASDRYQHMDEVIVDLRKVRVDNRTDEHEISTPQRFRRNRWYLAGGALLLFAVLFLLLFPKSKTSDEAIHSIAVLPLENLSGDPEQEYFAEGMTEVLITDLGKISALRVISRTSVMQFKATKKTIPEIAKELNVDAIVEGSVQRSGDRVRITAQLLYGPTDRHLWGESYERNLTDVLGLQSELALAIAKEIRAKVTPQEETHLTSAGPVNKEAYELYLKGRYHWNKRTEEGLKKGIEHFKQAIEKDPGYALAYAGLADSYFILAYYSWLPPKEAYPKARAAAMKALELDDLLAEGRAALASVKRDFEWDWVEAEKQFRQAFKLTPSYAYAHQWCANLFNLLGRREEALTEMKKALELDPLSLIINADLGRTYYWARQYDQSLEQFRKTLDLDPNFALAHLWLGQVYEQRRMYETAISEFQKGISLSGGGSTYALARLGHAYAVAGRRVEAQMVLNQLNDLSKQKYVSPYDIAVIYAGMGEKNQAFAWLERAYDERSVWMTHLKVDPSLDPLRSDLRFTELLKKIRLQPRSN
jgi:serine/threonine protein kinase/Flp pilus assembly protein TadD